MIDVFQLFWLGKMSAFTRGVQAEMTALRDEGKVRWLCASIHDRPRAGRLAADSILDALMIRYNAAHPGAEQEIFPHLAARRPAVVSYTATAWRKLLAAPKGWTGRVPTAGDCYRFVPLLAARRRRAHRAAHRRRSCGKTWPRSSAARSPPRRTPGCARSAGRCTAEPAPGADGDVVVGMNLILLLPDDGIDGAGRVRLRGRRLAHVLDVHRASVGDELRVGLLGGGLGTGRVLQLTPDVLEMEVSLERAPPPPLPLTLLLALPRPKVLRRVLRTASSMGVKRIVLLNARRVEKSYWQSPYLETKALEEQLLLGLEQARDTLLPEILLRPLFRPFVEDELPGIAGTRCGWSPTRPPPGSAPGTSTGP